MGATLIQAWRLTRRELRGGIAGFRVVIACLALGVAAIAMVGGTGQSIEEGLQRDGRALLGGDVELRLVQRPHDPEQIQYFRDTAAAQSVILETRAMALANDKRVMVELKGVDNAYPLVGAMELQGGGALDDALAQRDGAWGAVAEQTVFNRLGLKPGDNIRLGSLTIQLRDVIEREPDRIASVVNFGPRLMIAEAAMAETGLIQPGSQIRYRARVLVGGGQSVGDWVDAVKARFPEAGWRIRDTGDSAPGLSRFIERMTLFMSFVALSALLVGGIGVANGVAAYLEGKISSIASYKCLGAPARLIFWTYFLQVLVLALIGIVIGLVAGVTLPIIGLGMIQDMLPVRAVTGIYWEPVVMAALFGLLTAVTFSLWPLLKARTVPASALFRDRITPIHRTDPRALAAVVAAVVVLALFTILTASDRGFAVWFVGGTTAALLLLRLASGLIRRLAPRMTGLGGAPWRLGVGNLFRAGNRTDAVTLSLGLGLAVMVAMTLIEGNLSQQIQSRIPEKAPAFFFLDIQSDQAKEFDEILNATRGVDGLVRRPTMRGRIVGIGGKPAEQVMGSTSAHWALRGDRALTYLAEKPEEAEIVAGQWWPADYAGPPKISLDSNIARDFGVGVGDTLTLNVLGREITAEIASLRAIDWRSLRFDFAIIFAPGTLEQAPHTHLAAANAPEEVEDLLEKRVTDRFANITAIRVREALDAANQLLGGIGMAIRGAASVALVAGAIVLAGAVAAGHHRRVYDAVVFKVLGARRRTVIRAYLVEYGLLGLATGTAALAVGTLTAWAVTVFLMRMDWTFLTTTAVVTTLASLLVVVAGGLAGTWFALGQPASRLLRNE